MDRPHQSGAPRGMTLVELMFVVAILGVIVAGITKTMIDLDRTSRVRNLNVSMQGEGRDALQIMVRDVRQASLGSALGVIWTQDTLGNVVQRPAVQLYDNVTGGTGAGLDVKPGTDALLVVGATRLGAVAAAQGTMYDSTQTLTVTQTDGFAAGGAVLAGPYQEAAWGIVGAVVPASAGVPGGLNLSTTQNVFPKGKLDAGSMVRGARARLYYVDTADELVQMELSVPRAPGAGEPGARSVIARGVENMQVDCETDSGVAAGPCPAVAAGDPVTTEAAWAFGTWGAGAGARLTAGSVPALRNVIVQVVLRSQSDLRGQQGDPAIAIGNQAALPAAVSDPTQPYLRRAYRLPVAVRNTSLGAF